jgi:hypothetical protein
MKFLVILLSGMLLGGCAKCAYGYSSSCYADDAYDQQQQDEENKDKEKEKSTSTSWN